MREYVRPEIEDRVFVDASGRVIDYGNRWEEYGGTPPHDSYSVASHTERFAPLPLIAEALIAHLIQTYDVIAEEGAAVALDVERSPEPDEIVRAVRLTPARDTAAPLTVVFTRYPGVMVRAGELYHAAFPHCGCDACDEAWEPLAEQMESDVLNVVAGDFREFVSAPRRARPGHEQGTAFGDDTAPTIGYFLGTEDRGGGQEWEASALEPERLAAVTARLAALAAAGPGGHWQPWPR